MKSNPNDEELSPLESHFKSEQELRALETQSRDYLIAGFPVGGVPLRRRPDKRAIIDSAVEHLKNPGELADMLMTDPLSAENDYGVVVSLKMIERMAAGPKDKYSTWAKGFLRHIKQDDLLPRDSKGKPVRDTSPNAWLHAWKENSEEAEGLYEIAKEYEEKLISACPGPHRKRAGDPYCAPLGGKPPIYECCIKRALKLGIDEDIPGELSRHIPRKGTSITDIALLLIHHDLGVPFPALKKRYYQITEKGRFLDPEKDKIEKILDEQSGFKGVKPQ